MLQSFVYVVGNAQIVVWIKSLIFQSNKQTEEKIICIKSIEWQKLLAAEQVREESQAYFFFCRTLPEKVIPENVFGTTTKIHLMLSRLM